MRGLSPCPGWCANPATMTLQPVTVYMPEPGQSLEDFAANMVLFAWMITGTGMVVGEFEGVKMLAMPGTTRDDLIKFFKDSLPRRP